MITGRPTKYKKTLDEDAYKLCLLNATDKQIADFFNITESTYYLWKTKHKSFATAIKEGKEIADLDVARSLYKKAMGAPYKKQQAVKVKKAVLNDDGEVVGYEETVEIADLHCVDVPDTKALEFWLRNRHKDLWNQDKEIADKEDNTAKFKAFVNGVFGDSENNDTED